MVIISKESKEASREFTTDDWLDRGMSALRLSEKSGPGQQDLWDRIIQNSFAMAVKAVDGSRDVMNWPIDDLEPKEPDLK